MVTYFCSSCGSYLKKKQGVEHGFCNQDLSCVICKTEVHGNKALRMHNCEQPERKKDLSSLSNLDDINWRGFKNTIRKIVKV